MQIITIFNEKGGVGKTTLAGLIGAGLALRDQRVLLIDADGQGDLTVNMGLPRTSSFYDFIKRGDASSPNYVKTSQLVQRVPADNCPGELYLIAGNNESWGIPSNTSLREIVLNFNARLKQVEKHFDVVLIDTQPSATAMHDAIGLITDWFICPTDPEPLSAFGGLRSTLRHIDHIRQQSLNNGRDKAKVMAIIPNKFRTTTSLHKHVLRSLRDGVNDEPGYGDLVWQPLPLRTNIPEAQFLQTTVMYDAPELETNVYIWSLVDRVQRTLKEKVNG